MSDESRKLQRWLYLTKTPAQGYPVYLNTFKLLKKKNKNKKKQAQQQNQQTKHFAVSEKSL